MVSNSLSRNLKTVVSAKTRHRNYRKQQCSTSRSYFFNKFLKLAAPSPQLYASAFADAAYSETVLRNASAAGERVGTAYIKYPELADHFLYGSDWSLLITQGKNDVYLKNFISQMKHLDVPRKPGDPVSNSQRFFGWNAVTYAGLAQDGATRKRLEAFYVKNNVSKPLWAQKVDNRSNV